MTKTLYERVTEATHSYIGRLPCGCVVAAAVDIGGRQTGKAVSNFIAAGLSVERVPHEYVQQHLTAKCPHGNQRR